MSINHCSSSSDTLVVPETRPWWLNESQRFDLNDIQGGEEENGDVVLENANAEAEEEEEEEEEEAEEAKEAMFEKALTPSDVGKLNRLVIPKQHAEKYFPLDSAHSKGLLLSFEDESGKCWRFRYSYWNSSQSYVLTKGWSRYVKDKRLNAGDVVFFLRHATHHNRFFISSTRRHHPPQSHSLLHAPPGGGSQSQSQWQCEKERGNSSTSSSSSPSCRVLRLFGVNMECQPDNDSETSTPECSYNIMSSTQGTHLFHQPSYSSPNPHHHMLPQQQQQQPY